MPNAASRSTRRSSKISIGCSFGKSARNLPNFRPIDSTIYFNFKTGFFDSAFSSGVSSFPTSVMRLTTAMTFSIGARISDCMSIAMRPMPTPSTMTMETVRYMDPRDSLNTNSRLSKMADILQLWAVCDLIASPRISEQGPPYCISDSRMFL